MALSVLNRGEVILNDIKFKLGGDGMVRPFYASQFAPKQVIGDYTKDSDPSRSTWVIVGDQSGGIGVEKMTATRQANRSWWTECNVEYPGHCFLPRLATTIAFPTLPTIVDGALDIWTTATNLTNWTETLNGGLVEREATIKHTAGAAAYSAKITGATTTIAQTLAGWSTDFIGKLITISIWTYGTGGGVPTIAIYDGVGTTTVNLSSAAAWTQGFISRTIAAAATEITVTITGVAAAVYFDDVTIAAAGAITNCCNFTTDTYVAAGAVLFKLDSVAGASYYLSAIFPANITKLVASVGSCLYIFLGDSASYWYMDSAGAFTQAVGSDGAGGGTSSAATYVIHWNNQLNKITVAGAFSISTAPNSATPTWTAKKTLDTGSQGTIQGLITYASSTASDIIYCGTTKGLVALNYTNNLWLNTELQLPVHADNGKGMVVQNGKLYYSAGLSVYEYSLAGGSLTIRNMGLDSDDGVPTSLNGSITALIGGYYGDFYALVDGSLSGTALSTVYQYSKGAWVALWRSLTSVTLAGIVSSTFAYRLYFNYGTTIYYMTLSRAKISPLAETTSYAGGSYYFSPWFDGDWFTGNKLALAVRAFAINTTATETVRVRYRTGYSTSLSTGFATVDGGTGTLVLADAGVEKVWKFASGAGLSFKTIQFEVLIQSGTVTLTPDLQSLTLEYEKVIPAKWGFGLTLDCRETYANLTPVQQRDALITAIESQTLVTFYYGGPSEPRYVRIKPAEGERLTGQGSMGQYRLVAVEK